ncbi:hypothetical protein BXY57_2143 [Thermoflavifilum aggregans]|uniref:YXWGXW repeat-containing protein n=1 Tax=Thermoflavifilum aggregans TaxID=454188 RepID=A0A2M9CXA6_9BACT|nr:hypothetical protein [Thermoflavifilum aggregans]PJJ76517.1 hypothetical protein BXY57_2143 [Thermoflavifilum aggregans]
MKSLSYMLLGIGLLLGGCATAYRAGQTPDDVYYSPAQTQEAVAATNNSSSSAVSTENGDHYIVYDDQNNNGLTYTQRLQMFNDPNYFYDPFIFYNSYAFNPYFAYSSWWGPSFAWSLSFGNYYSPFYWNPWYPGYYAWYSPYLWYTPYAWYGLPYGYYGYAGGKYIVNPRPANTYAPRVNYEARSGAMNGISTGSNGTVNTNAPRVFYNHTNGNTSSPLPPSNTRRIFTTPQNETPATNISTPARNRRVFIQQPDEHPVSTPSNNRGGFFRMFRSNENNLNSTSRFQQAPDRSFETRSFSSPTPMFRSAPVENAAPVRTFSPRGGR